MTPQEAIRHLEAAFKTTSNIAVVGIASPLFPRVFYFPKKFSKNRQINSFDSGVGS
jgi:hypothetical protein